MLKQIMSIVPLNPKEIPAQQCILQIRQQENNPLLNLIEFYLELEQEKMIHHLLLDNQVQHGF